MAGGCRMSCVAQVTILSDQSVVCSVFTPCFSIGSACLVSWWKWYQKKYQGPDTFHNFCQWKPKEEVSRVESSRYHAVQKPEMSHSARASGLVISLFSFWEKLEVNRGPCSSNYTLPPKQIFFACWMKLIFSSSKFPQISQEIIGWETVFMTIFLKPIVMFQFIQPHAW